MGRSPGAFNDASRCKQHNVTAGTVTSVSQLRPGQAECRIPSTIACRARLRRNWTGRCRRRLSGVHRVLARAVARSQTARHAITGAGHRRWRPWLLGCAPRRLPRESRTTCWVHYADLRIVRQRWIAEDPQLMLNVCRGCNCLLHHRGSCIPARAPCVGLQPARRGSCHPGALDKLLAGCVCPQRRDQAHGAPVRDRLTALLRQRDVCQH